MKPPVDAPTSTATSPAGSMSKASRAAISLWAPRLTHSLPAASDTGAAAVHEIPGLEVVPGAVALPHPHLPGQHQRLGTRPRRDETPLHEELVEADALRGGGRHGPYRGTARVTRAYQTGERPGQAGSTTGAGIPSWASVSATWAVSPGTSRRISRRRSVTAPWSTNRSPGIPRMRTGMSR